MRGLSEDPFPTAGGQETIAPAREGLVDLCDGDDELLEEEELRRYLVVLNEPLFQEYDLDCSGMIEGPEEAMYFAAERAKADRRLAEAQDR